MNVISFELTMPNVGSWNGHWTGESNKYYVIRRFRKEILDKLMEGAESHPIYEGIFVRKQVGTTPLRKNHYYNFGDGWGANVCMEVVDAREAHKREKISRGFCGYEWMISSIISYGEILSGDQIKKLKEIENDNSKELHTKN